VAGRVEDEEELVLVLEDAKELVLALEDAKELVLALENAAELDVGKRMLALDDGYKNKKKEVSPKGP
jgi:hypothetical protein